MRFIFLIYAEDAFDDGLDSKISCMTFVICQSTPWMVSYYFDI